MSSRPLALNFLNGVAAVGGATGLSPHRNLSFDQLHDRARRATGLDDFGDPRYQHPMQMLLDDYAHESRLTHFGQMTVTLEALRILKNRLAVEAIKKQRPEIGDEKVVSPIFIVGLPRTGTTLLHHLLAQDAAHRPLIFWEARWPTPIPESSPLQDAKRKGLARGVVKALDFSAPTFRAIHPVYPVGPEECLLLFQQSFESYATPYLTRTPTFEKWLLETDLKPGYEEHREMLKFLQHGRPEKKWLLKSPFHVGYLDVLLDLYPDATILHTHRDPIKVLPSMCSLRESCRASCSDDLDIENYGKEMMEVLTTLLGSAIEIRERESAPSDSSGDGNRKNARFMDIYFEDIVADPVRYMEKVYERFDWTLTGETTDRMKRWMKRNPAGKHGKHKYEAGRYGTSDEEVAKRFKFYTDKFNLG